MGFRVSKLGVLGRVKQHNHASAGLHWAPVPRAPRTRQRPVQHRSLWELASSPEPRTLPGHSLKAAGTEWSCDHALSTDHNKLADQGQQPCMNQASALALALPSPSSNCMGSLGGILQRLLQNTKRPACSPFSSLETVTSVHVDASQLRSETLEAPWRERRSHLRTQLRGWSSSRPALLRRLLL